MWSLGRNYEQILERLGCIAGGNNRTRQTLIDLGDRIASLTRKVDDFMADRGALDAGIASLGTAVTQLVQITQQLIAKNEAVGNAIDFSAEQTQLNDIIANVNAELGNVKTAINAPVVEQPPTVDTPATDVPPATQEGTPTPVAPIADNQSGTQPVSEITGTAAANNEVVHPEIATEENTAPHQ